MIPAVMPTYGRADVAFERGDGPYLYATDGRRFLDFGCGIAVTLLGHNPAEIGYVAAAANRGLGTLDFASLNPVEKTLS